MNVLRFFDPADQRFVGRMVRLALAGVALLACGILVAAGLAWRSERVRFGVAFVLAESDLPAPALTVSRQLVRDFPTSNWDYYRLKAMSLRRMGRIEDSLAVYDDAVAARPDWWWAHSHRCFYNALYGDPASVMDSCDRQFALEPDEIDVAYERRAIARGLTGDLEGALADLERALPLIREADAEDWRIPVRERWLMALRAGENPFTEAELAEERTHY
jgi:tetratricopeptide (TPR) repeat protein